MAHATGTINEITLHYPKAGQPSATMANERDQAIADLCSISRFQPLNDKNGPYRLDLAIHNKQLVFQIKNANGDDLPSLILSLSPYRRIIRDYFLMIESYEQARIEGKQARLEPIDMARRGLHNEAADLMIERLADKVTLDHDTARRIFTLICVLHLDQARLWR
jgi:uncharacterized protein (UPF0262 family)